MLQYGEWVVGRGTGRGGPETIRRLLQGARWQITEVVELGEVGGFGVYFV